MRTTLAIDDDVLLAAKEIASLERRSVGEVVSDLARRGLRKSERPAGTRNGVKLLPRRPGAPVTSEKVAELLNDLP